MQCQVPNPWRNVMHINVTRHGPYVVVDIKANAFVHHMVRMSGSLMEVVPTTGRRAGWRELLAAKEKNAGGSNGKSGRAVSGRGDCLSRSDLPGKTANARYFWRTNENNAGTFQAVADVVEA
ncbi:hypothetical protein ACNKHS_14100 [Shigella flexneri]